MDDGLWAAGGGPGAPGLLLSQAVGAGMVGSSAPNLTSASPRARPQAGTGRVLRKGLPLAPTETPLPGGGHSLWLRSPCPPVIPLPCPRLTPHRQHTWKAPPFSRGGGGATGTVQTAPGPGIRGHPEEAVPEGPTRAAPPVCKCWLRPRWGLQGAQPAEWHTAGSGPQVCAVRPRGLAGLGCGRVQRSGPRRASVHPENSSQGGNPAQPRTTPPPSLLPAWCPPLGPHCPSSLTCRCCPLPQRGPGRPVPGSSWGLGSGRRGARGRAPGLGCGPAPSFCSAA